MKRTTLLIPLTLASLLLLGGCVSQAPVAGPGPVSQPSTTTVQPTTPSTGAVAVQQPVPAETNPPGDIPDNQAFVAYVVPGGFSVKVPEGWSRVSTASSAEFTDKLNTIRVSWAAAPAAPTVANVTSTDIPKLKASETAFEFVSVKAVALPAGASVLTIYRINSAPNQVTGKQYRLDVERYSVFRNGVRVDLTLLSPVGSDNVDPWRIVSTSLTWK